MICELVEIIDEKDKMGVYILSQDGIVVYVGFSTDVYARVRSHRMSSGSGYEFNAAHFIPSGGRDECEMKWLEDSIIEAWKPKYNRQYHTGLYYKNGKPRGGVALVKINGFRNQ